MNYSEIKKMDIANGLGIRVSLFVSGCRNKCKGCFNQVTWDFNYGNLFDEKVEEEILEALQPNHITGLSVLGGEPFEEENQAVLAPFLEKVKERFPEKNIWCWSGYLLDDDLLNESGKKHTAFTNRMLDCMEFLVDGRFVEEKRNITLDFRGSENQRIWQKIDGNWEVVSGIKFN